MMLLFFVCLFLSFLFLHPDLTALVLFLPLSIKTDESGEEEDWEVFLLFNL